jgi:hypothetical protein
VARWIVDRLHHDADLGAHDLDVDRGAVLGVAFERNALEVHQ